MLKILDVTFPFFALVLVGWFAARRRWMPLEAIPGLNLFVLYFALPCMLLRFAAATPIARMVDPGVLGTWLVCALAMVALALLAARGLSGRPRMGWDNAAFGALVAAFPNSGFMGVPLLVDLLGQRAAAPAIVALSMDMIVTSSLCIALSRLDAAGSHGAGRAAMNALKGVLVNPLPWAIGAGCAVSASGGSLPHLVMKPVTMLADAASPAALFTLGAVLARSQAHSQARSQARAEAAEAVARPADAAAAPAHHPLGDVPWVVALKLVVHPLLVWLACQAAIALGVPLDADAVLVLTLLAALPSASNVPMLAERFQADAGRIAQIVLLTTALAFVTFTALVALLVG
ncbi:AEC family transporter [Leptothrix discophora]|uniref:AEC family transporter n=1 Tax=Leptothrix discophora TaxID=89 RepID=A0ABT9G4L2_LEPDI|nr:AEC family transporter [Leptothrix discophora]MDP4301419.1 AEC family transporter [Leptothrix discophora]